MTSDTPSVGIAASLAQNIRFQEQGGKKINYILHFGTSETLV